MTEKTKDEQEQEKERMFRRNYGDYLTEYPDFSKNTKNSTSDADEYAETDNKASLKGKYSYIPILAILVTLAARFSYRYFQKKIFYNFDGALGFSQTNYVFLWIIAAIFLIYITAEFTVIKEATSGKNLKKRFKIVMTAVIGLIIYFTCILFPFFCRQEIFSDRIKCYDFFNRCTEEFELKNAKDMIFGIKRTEHRRKNGGTYYTYELELTFEFEDKYFSFSKFQNQNIIFDLYKDYAKDLEVYTNNKKYYQAFIEKNENKYSFNQMNMLDKIFNKR